MNSPANRDKPAAALTPGKSVRETPIAMEETFQLLTDKPRPAQLSRSVERAAEVLDSALLARLRTLSEAWGVPLTDVVLAGFAVLLSRYTGEEEVAIMLGGSPRTAGGEAKKRVAHIRIGDDDGFLKVLRRTEEAKACAAETAESASSVGFWSSSSSKAELRPSEKLALDVALFVEDAKPEAKLFLDYSPDLFEAATPKRLLRGLHSVLAGAVANPETPVRQLPILSEAERATILYDWNRTESDVWHGQCLHQLFEEQAKRSPEAVAVEHDGVRLSYAELNARANQLARHLLASGAEPKSFIGICLPPCADFAVATLAILKAGCACMPLDPKYPPDRIAYMVQDAGTKFVLTLRGALPSGLPNGITAIDLASSRDLIGCQSREDSEQAATLSDIAYLIYTSGSTGQPRGVLLRHAGLANYNLASARFYQMSPSDRVLQFCSLSFDAAVEEIFATLASGATLVFRSKDMPLDVPGFLHWVRREKITVLDLPTAYWHEWISQFDELSESVPNGLRLVIVGGEKALASALETWRRVRHGVRWVNTYGPTEASIAVTRYDPDEERAASTPENVPIGRPIENCRAYVLDRDRNPVSIGVAGELYLGGIGVAQGYLNRAELTAQKFLADPFSTDPDARLYRTGDMVRFLETGMLEYLGRQDDQVKVRGFRIELGEIEEVLARHELVSESAVVAVDDPVQGKTLIAYCSLSGAARPDAPDLRAFVASKLPPYMVPSAVVVLGALPKTPNGKIDRHALARMERTTVLSSAEVDLPATALEIQLKKIWEDTLGREPIGIRENFFELGGHSLLAARLMQKISRMQGKTIPLGLLFEAPTIEKLAEVLERNEWAQQWSCLVPIQPQGSRPPFFCVHGVGGNVVGFRELARLMSPDYPFFGFQAQGLDGTGEPFSEIGAMAAHYIREMRSVQSEGPFYLGGYSFGGLVAYEMARQLHQGGEEVALLALLDTYPGELEAISTSIWKLLLEPKRLRLLSDVPRTAKKSVQRRVKGLFLSKTLKDVLQANHGASARYVLEPYEGETTLFRAEQSSLRAFDDPHAAWASLAVGGLHVVEIAGDHGDILVVPQVDELATKLKAAIDLASAESEVREDRKEEAIA
jgi:amino acid adenylation domain-containing protein